MRILQSLLVIGLTLSLGFTDAIAGGFTLPGTGSRAMSRGAAFTALADDLTAIAINPGGLSRLSGTHILYNHNFHYTPSAFTRYTPTAMEDSFPISDRPGDPGARVENETPFFALGAMLGVATDFGLDDWTFALGIYGPNAVGNQQYATDGGQRYMLTSLEMLLVYYTLGVSWGHKDTFGIGATVQYAHLPVTKFGQVVDGTLGGTPSPYYSTTDLEAILDLDDPGTMTAQIGAWWRIIPELEFGISARVVPVMLNPTGKVQLNKLDGQNFAGNPDSTVTLQGGDASLDITLPIILRTGLRYRHLSGEREVFDLELDFVYEAWSSIDAYDIELSGSVDIDVDGPNGTVPPINTALTTLTLEKRWRDTYSVRFGGTWNAVEDLFSVSAGALWESGASHNRYSHLDFPSFDRLGFGAGFRLQGSGVDFSLAYLHILQEDREVSEQIGKVFQQRPLSPCPENCGPITGVPANAGTFETAFHQLQLSLSFHIDAWL